MHRSAIRHLQLVFLALILGASGCASYGQQSEGVTSPQPSSSITAESIVLESSIQFKPLSADEGLEYEFVTVDEATHFLNLVVYAAGKTRRRVLALPSYFLSDQPTQNGKGTGMVRDGLNKRVKWIAVQLSTGKTASDPDSSEVWFIDGRSGVAKKLLTAPGFFFTIDDLGEVICVYDGDLSFSQMIPTVVLYEIATMKALKTAQYLPFKNITIGPMEMSYRNGVFYVALGNLGLDSAIMKIPIHN
jgi:hypothetical protein